MTTILVTGSEGAIGDFVIRDLYKQLNNLTVIRISRTKSSNIDGRSKYYWGDLTDTAFLQMIFSENSVNIVIACAAKWNGINQDKSIINNNMILTSSLLHAIPVNLDKLIFISSSAVYQAPNYSDQIPIANYPNSTYGGSKLISEIMIEKIATIKGFLYTIYRPFHVVSPLENFERGRSHVCTDFCHRIFVNNEDLDINSLPHENGIGFMWVEDFSDIIVSNLKNSETDNQIINVGTTEEHSIKKLAIEIEKIAHSYDLNVAKSPDIFLKPFSLQLDGRFNKLQSIYPSFRSTRFKECVSKFIKFKYLKGN
jgi:nucleoside-diphosphate-sugar epimerase